MFTSMTARVSTNTYCLARTRRFSRRSENSVGRVTYEREAPTDTVQLVKFRIAIFYSMAEIMLLVTLRIRRSGVPGCGIGSPERNVVWKNSQVQAHLVLTRASHSLF